MGSRGGAGEWGWKVEMGNKGGEWVGSGRVSGQTPLLNLDLSSRSPQY